MSESTSLALTAPVAITVAIARESRAIGKNGRLLWHIPADLKRFKELTLGCPVVMGRKTFESIVAILGKPLPGRTNIVVTRQSDYAYPEVTVVSSLEAGLQAASIENPREIHIGGGADIYRQALPYVDRLYVTYVEDEPEADTFFPAFGDEFTVVKEYEPAEHGDLRYQWVDLKRI